MKKTIILILALVMIVLSLVLVGCDKNTPDENESSDVDTTVETTAPETTESETTDTEAPESTEPAGPEITIFADGKVQCDIVIGDKASSVISGAANDLKAAFGNKLGATPNVRKEGTFKTLNGGTIDVPKIVVGTLKEDEYSKTLASEFENNSDHIITAQNGTLYIIGKTDASTAIAVNTFIGFWVKSGLETLAFDMGEVECLPANYDGITIAGNPIVNYSIVYYSSYYATECATNLQTAIHDRLGISLPLVSEGDGEGEYEILVGKTGRTEAKELRGAYDRPNVYYDVKTVGDKLVVMGEGYRTLQKVEAELIAYFKAAENDTNLTGTVLSGDILADVDAVDCMTDALEKADSVDARVLHWNMAAPLSWNQSEEKWGANWPFDATATGRKMRAEQQADVVLIYNPDIVTTNEIYANHASGTQYNTFVKELSEHFTLIESNYDTRDDDMPKNVPTQAENNTAYGNPEQILIRKGKFTVVDSGWRYLSDGTTFHGIHWAVLETTEGQKFITSVAHYGDARREVTFGSEHLSAVRFAQQCSGSSTLLPVILTGDMFTYVNHSASSAGATYYYLEGYGYSDSQVSTQFNCNDDAKGNKHGTFHDPMNDSSKGRASEDFVWYNNKLVSNKFGVIVIPESTNTSDHWPVFSDLSFATT